jgi:hypothetical protein
MNTRVIKWISVTEAVRIAEVIGHPVSRVTIISWTKQFPNMGKKVGGRWRIDKDALIFYLNEGTE